MTKHKHSGTIKPVNKTNEESSKDVSGLYASAVIRKHKGYIVAVVGLFLAGVTLWGASGLFINADTSTTASFQAEAGTLANCATQVTDATAAGGGTVLFGGAACTPPQQTTYGASLPITYSLASLTGTQRFVATNGSDTTGTGAVGAPYATVTRAYSAASSGDSIVVRGGTYRQGNIAISSSKPVKIIAYPGEIPVFNGAQAVSGGWTTEGSFQYRAYTPMPVTDGSGISFTTGQNLTGDGVGKFPDQAWVGTTQLRQVSAKSSLANGTFWVDTANNRLYMTATNVAQGNVEISQNRMFITVQAANTTLEGIRITRYSNTASDYGVVKFTNASHNGVIRNVEISDTAFIAVLFGSSGIHNNGLIKNVTISHSNWMGVSANITDNLTLDSVKLTNMNQFNEFTHSPQSGALKTSRTRYTKVLNSYIASNNSHGLWFDQSNIDVDVANNQILDNAGSGLFFEISDDLLLINNYIRATGGAQAVKLAGSSGLKLVNNTIYGGSSPIGIYTDNRSIVGCADPSKPLCADSYNSDRDSIRTYSTKLDWMPRLDLMLNNIIAYPNTSGYCGTTIVCITLTNGSASTTIQAVIHKAESARGIPQTQINGNVYANGSGNLLNAPSAYTSLTTFANAMAGSPVGISGFEANGRAGNSWVNSDGSPTATLTAVHNQAPAVPTDADINQYIPAGTRHYGVTNK
jgi:hypothetical protein